MTVVLRRAELGDVDALGELHSFCWTELYSAVIPPHILAELSPETMAGLWKRFVTRGDEYIQWVAELDGQIVGFAGRGPGRETGYEVATELYFIYVHPHHRRAKIGKQLLAKADVDYLWIAEANRDSRAFYRKNKFYPDSVAREGAIFGAPLPEVRMAR
jgi:GNAT superfamily N-acetyltransferase